MTSSTYIGNEDVEPTEPSLELGVSLAHQQVLETPKLVHGPWCLDPGTCLRSLVLSDAMRCARNKYNLVIVCLACESVIRRVLVHYTGREMRRTYSGNF